MPISVFSIDIIILLALEIHNIYVSANKVEYIFQEKDNLNYLTTDELGISNFTKSDSSYKNESLISTSQKTKYSRFDLNLIKSSGRKFVIYDNYIIDISEFMYYHPGGLIHIEENLYSDISRFVTGTISLNKNFNSYSHSYSAINFLHTKILGIIVDNHNIILDKDLGGR